MRAYIIRRLLISIPLVLLMTFVIFAVINTNPQSALEPYMLNPNISFQVIEQVKERTGFYDAMPVRYAKWLSGVLFDIRIGRERRSLVSFADPRQFPEQFAIATWTRLATETGTLTGSAPRQALGDDPETVRRLADLGAGIASFRIGFEVTASAEPTNGSARLIVRLQGLDATNTLEQAVTLPPEGGGDLLIAAQALRDAGLSGRPLERFDLLLEGGGAVAIRAVDAGLDLYGIVRPERQRPFLAMAFPAGDTAVTLRNPGSPHLSYRLRRTDWQPRGKTVGYTDAGDPVLCADVFRRLVIEAGNPTDQPATYELRLRSGGDGDPVTTAVSFTLNGMERATRGFFLDHLAAAGVDLGSVHEIAFAATAASKLTVYRLELEMDGRALSIGGKPDFGRSHDNIPVIEKLAGRIRNTVGLVFFAMLITWAVALPAGVIAAVRQYGFSDRILSFLTFVGMSLPSFFLAVLVRTLLQEAAQPDSVLSFLPSLPNSGRASIHFESLTPWQQTVDLIRHAIAPTLVLALGGMAGMQRVMRGTMLEAQRQQYIVTARAKGLPERIVIYKHALRNAITPFVAGFGSILPGLIGGSLFVEMVFNYPGVGQMMYPAVLNRDLNLVMANTLIAALLLVVGNLIADILLALVDPRVSYD